MEVDPCVLHEASELGIKYVAAMMLAGEYAYAGREWVVEKVNSIIEQPPQLRLARRARRAGLLGRA
jgi:RNA-splicing ligase RtcB